eukprot:scaffold53501_cov69-Phaeocystis_antarctica.AAC.2
MATRWLQDGKGHCLAWLVPALPSFDSPLAPSTAWRGVSRHQGLALPSAEYFSLTVGTAV